MAPSTSRELSAAVAAGRFTSIETAILGAALEALAPWSGHALLQRVPECSKSSFYRALKRLRVRRIIREAFNTGGKWIINASVDHWKNRACDAPLFTKGTPEMLGLSRRMEGASPATETAKKPPKTRRVAPVVEEPLPRPGTDANGDPKTKEPTIWQKAKKAMREAHGGM